MYIVITQIEATKDALINGEVDRALGLLDKLSGYVTGSIKRQGPGKAMEVMIEEDGGRFVLHGTMDPLTDICSVGNVVAPYADLADTIYQAYGLPVKAINITQHD